MASGKNISVPTKVSEPTHPLSPTYFFDQENVRHLSQELFNRYMIVLEILSQERLGKPFTGDASSMRSLMTEITVFDIFVVTSALIKTPALVEGYDISHVPKSYDEWISRYRADPALHTSMDDLSIEVPPPKRPALERMDASTSGTSDEAAIASKPGKGKAKAESPPKKKKAQPIINAKPDPKVNAQADAAGKRPLSPVSQQIQMTYASVTSSKERKRLTWLRAIPIIEDVKLEDARKAVVRGCRYQSPRLTGAIPEGVEKADWRQVFTTLGSIYRPVELIYISGPKADVAFV